MQFTRYLERDLRGGQSREKARIVQAVGKDRRPPRGAGFTLLEMLAVLAIAGFLAALVVTSVAALLHGQRLHGGVEWVASLVGENRGRAIAERKTFELKFLISSSSVELRAREKDGSSTTLEGPIPLDARLAFFRGEEPKEQILVTLHPDGSLSLAPDAPSLSFDENPAAAHDLGIQEREGTRKAYLDFVAPTARVRTEYVK